MFKYNRKKLFKKEETNADQCVNTYYTYVATFDNSSYDFSELEVRFEMLMKIVEAFKKHQVQLEEEDLENEEEKVRGAFKETLLTVQAKIKMYIRKTNISTTATKTQVRLPKVDLLKYDGDINKWPNFKDLFTELVHNNETISAVQKLMFFKSTLNSHALNMIPAIPVIGKNYHAAWQLLIDRYDSLHMLVSSYFKVICEETVIKKGSSDELKKIISELNQNIRALQK